MQSMVFSYMRGMELNGNYSPSIQINKGAIVILTNVLVLTLEIGSTRQDGERRIYPRTFCKVFETRGIKWNSMLDIFKFIHIMG